MRQIRLLKSDLTPSRKRKFLFIGCIIIVLIAVLITVICAGCHYESKKFRSFLVVIVLVLLFQYLIGDPLRFLGESIYVARRKYKNTQTGNDDLGRTAGDPQPDSYALLRLRIASYRSQMMVSPEHSNEALNERYKLIAHELWLYGKYFLLLLVVVVSTRDYLAYYNTRTLHSVLRERRLAEIGLDDVSTIDELHVFLERIVVMAFNDGKDYNGQPMPEPGWVQFGLGKLLGVVRLRQVRRKEEYIGLAQPRFETDNFQPRWVWTEQQLHYTDKYWRIYEPWLQHQQKDAWLFQLKHPGHMHDYDETSGYVMLLARDYNNSMKILDYMRNSSWLDRKTSALFIDFTLYHVDSNLFSVCTLLFEQTPFGSLLGAVHVHSVELMMNIDHLSPIGLLILLLYTLQLVQLIKWLVLKLWYREKDIRSIWNYVDWYIVILNVMAVVLLVLRETKVAQLLAEFEHSAKQQYTDFRIPAKIDYFLTSTLGFLICLTTLRLWKVMQFAKPFRLFTRTLFRASGALITLLVLIIIFLFAFGTSSCIINGNNTEDFTRLFKSFSSSMSLSFGFSSRLSPHDLVHGGATLGFILYVLLMFVVAILLINVFITVICDYFESSKESSEELDTKALSFIDFLKIEYGQYLQCFRKCATCGCRSRKYNRKRGTVKEYVAKSEKRIIKQMEKRWRAGLIEKEPRYGRHIRSINELQMLGEILNAQMEYLKRND